MRMSLRGGLQPDVAIPFERDTDFLVLTEGDCFVALGSLLAMTYS